jgi:hypothetical protein
MNGLRVIKGGRSFGGLARKAPKVRSFGAIPKALGQRLEPKDAYKHNGAHLNLIRGLPCLITGKRFLSFQRDGKLWMANVVAHHPDELFPGNIGQQMKCSDYLAVPLLAHLHDGFPESLHKHGGMDWWAQWSIDPYAWLADLLTRQYLARLPDHEGAAHALEQIRIVCERKGA